MFTTTYTTYTKSLFLEDDIVPDIWKFSCKKTSFSISSGHATFTEKGIVFAGITFVKSIILTSLKGSICFFMSYAHQISEL